MAPMFLMLAWSGDTIEQWMAAGGYVVLVGLLLLCGLGLPLPEDIPLIIAGALVATGKMNLAIAAVCAWCGIIGGDIMLYHLGKKFGLEITRVKFVGKHLTKARIERAEQFFQQYGIWVVAIGRLVAGIRGAMVVAAGATRFSFTKFIITDGLAALVSGGFFLALGYLLGQHLDWLLAVVGEVKNMIMLCALIVIAGVGFILWRRHQYKKLRLQQQAQSQIPATDQPPNS
jgi:membrane protein DedA with SNARE-associated domain